MSGTLNPTLPVQGEPRSSSDPHILGSLITIRDFVNTLLDGSNLVPDTSLTSPNNGAYRVLFHASQLLSLDTAAGTYQLGQLGGTGTVTSGGDLAGKGAAPPAFYFASAAYAVNGKTQKLRLRAQVAANATQPTITFTFGLYPITVAGGADALTVTLGTVVTGSTVAISSPAASTVTSGVNSDFAIPPDGAYAPGVVTSGTLTNNSAVLLNAQLETRSV